MHPPIPTTEPRSWKPRVSARAKAELPVLTAAAPPPVARSTPLTVSQLKLKAKPTNADLQLQNAELHGCVHANDARLSALARALGVDLPTREQLEQGIQPKVRGRLGSIRPWKAVAAAVPVIVAAMTAYHILEPAVVAFGAALHHALMAVR